MTGEKTLIIIPVLFLAAHLAQAQTPMENGNALELFSTGMYAPTEMAFDSSGNLFCGSGYEPTWPIGGTPTPIFKVFPDGTCVPFSLPISDPDALTVDANDDVFVGSYGGIITHIDGVTESPSTWVVDSRLKNIDGLRFSPAGDLYAVAIDSAKVHKINAVTKVVEEFADLSSLGVTGMSGIAFGPTTGNVFVESPLENIIVELAPDGTIVNPEVASGFVFLGFIDFAPSGKNEGYLFAPDAITGEIFKVDVTTGEKTLYIDHLWPGPVGLVFDASGDLYFNQNFDQVTDGRVYRAWETTLEVPPAPMIGDPIQVRYESKHDELVAYGAFIALDDNGPTLKDGRTFPLGLSPLLLLTQSHLDPTGVAILNMSIPADQALVGLEVYFAFATYSPAPFYFLSFSEAAKMEIH